ncbi:MAG: hypothetical protein PHV49_02825 [Alistipes sp.]|nr:hypothetical protein [Alistipes sp.]
MKQGVWLLVLLLSGWSLSAQSHRYDDELYEETYDEFYDAYDEGCDELYRFGFRLNNYASLYPDPFLLSLSREYGIPRNTLRLYLQRGYSPSDLFMGLEIARRTPFGIRDVLNFYRNSRDRNWISVSAHFGMGPNTPPYRLMIRQFQACYHYWNGYYVHRHPNRVPPPVYAHEWSYFRPHPVHPVRPPHPSHPVHPVPPKHPQRPYGHPQPEPPHPSVIHQPRVPQPSRPVPSDRPYVSTPARPSRPTQAPNPSSRPASGSPTVSAKPKTEKSFRQSETRVDHRVRSKSTETSATTSTTTPTNTPSVGQYRR